MTRIKHAALPLCLGFIVACGDSGPTVTHDMAVAHNDGGHDLKMGADAGPVMLQPVACDPLKQTGCPDATMPKCTAVVDTNMNDDLYNYIIAGCMPTETPTVGEDATCKRYNTTAASMGVGDDNCAVGTYCSGYGPLASSSPPPRRCHKFCTADTDCKTGYKCMALIDKDVDDGMGNAVPGPQAGMCVQSCTMLGTDCPAMYDCSLLVIDEDETTVAQSCRQAGTVAIGASCGGAMGATADLDCVAGGACLDLAPDGMTFNGSCYQLCDGTHACTGGKKCDPMPMLTFMGMQYPALPTLPGTAGICH